MAADPEGLYYTENFIPSDLATNIWNWLHSPDITSKMTSVGSGANSRRVYQLGYAYDYSRGATGRTADQFPEVINQLLMLLSQSMKFFGYDTVSIFNQCIINAYTPGQGINAHTDDKKYGPIIACFTLTDGPGREMEFTRNKEKFTVYTTNMSVYLMTGESRSSWKHAMKLRQTDTVNGSRLKRGLVYSITFRMWLN